MFSKTLSESAVNIQNDPMRRGHDICMQHFLSLKRINNDINRKKNQLYSDYDIYNRFARAARGKNTSQ